MSKKLKCFWCNRKYVDLVGHTKRQHSKLTARSYDYKERFPPQTPPSKETYPAKMHELISQRQTIEPVYIDPGILKESQKKVLLKVAFTKRTIRMSLKAKLELLMLSMKIWKGTFLFWPEFRKRLRDCFRKIEFEVLIK